jgi:type I site-specific restriction endonuclease
LSPSPGAPEQKARAQIDAALIAAGWIVQDRDAMNLSAGRGVAVREFKLTPGHGFADYLLFVDGKAVGILEAKPEGHTLSGVEVQAQKYSTGLPTGLNPPVEPLPFLYLSTGAITKFTSLLDPDPRSRRIFQVHQPATLAEWLAADTLDAWVKSAGTFTAADDTKPSSLRARLRAVPPVERAFLFPNQLQAVINLEDSLFRNRPRALVQMATGSGKTIMAVTAAYRLIKFGGARRVLFLVDRSNLGEQAEKEFQGYRTPDDNRKLTELYNVQRLTSNTIGASAKVVITTVQRLYSMLKGEPDLDPEVEEASLFEFAGAAMKGRGVRVIEPTELKAVTPDAHAKTHFVIVDCVGITETPLADTYPLERSKSVPFKALLEHVAMGGSDPDVLSSLASRLARLAKECGPDEHTRIREASGGAGLTQIAHGIVDALDPDLQQARARSTHGLPGDQEPTDLQTKQAAQALAKEAVEPLATRPGLRQLLQDIKRELEQVIDEVSRDALLFAGASAEAKEKAKALVASFEQFIADNKDEIDALQFFFSVPHRDRLRYDDIKALAATIKAPPRSWTPEVLSRAYELLEKDKVRGASGRRLLTDIVSLVRFALHQDTELVPHAERVRARFESWMAQQATRGRQFTEQQIRWLEMTRDHVATSLEIGIEDFDDVPFAQEGGRGRANQVFGKELEPLLRELNEALAA